VGELVTEALDYDRGRQVTVYVPPNPPARVWTVPPDRPQTAVGEVVVEDLLAGSDAMLDVDAGDIVAEALSRAMGTKQREIPVAATGRERA